VSSRTKRISSRISKLLSKRRNGGGGSESSISLPTLTLSSGQIVYPRLGLSPEEISSIHTKKLKASHFSVSPVELLQQQQQQQQGEGEGQQVQIGVDVTHVSSSTNSLLSFSKNAIQTAMTELQYVKLEQEKTRRRELRRTASTSACASSSINDSSSSSSSSSSPPLSSNIWNNSIAIVVDCNGDNYGALMTRSESSSLSLQLAHCYAAIKRANEAFVHASYSSSLLLGLVGLTSDRVRDLKKISGVERWKNVFSSISSLEEVFHLHKVKQSNSSSDAAAIKGGVANTGANSFTGTSLSTNSLPSTTISSSSIIVDGYITSSSSSSLPISNDSHNSQRMESSIESQTINLGIGNVPPPPSPNPSPSPPNPPRQIYYLTSDATEILWRPRPNATYIVGGIVDRNRFPQLALNRAKEIGVKTVRFPLEESLADLGHMHRHRILTTNKAVELLVEVVISSSGVQRKKRFIISNVDMDHNVHKEPDQEQQQKESHLVDESVCRDVDQTMSKKKRGIVIENDGNDDDDDDDNSDEDDHDDNDDDVESESLKVIWKKAIDKILLQRPLLQPLSRQEGEGGEAVDE
jgi:hypothetical protein